VVVRLRTPVAYVVRAELRERAIHLVREALAAESGRSLNQAVLRIGLRVGVGVTPETLCRRVKQAAMGALEVPRVTTSDSTRIKNSSGTFAS
jgi:transposase